MEFSIEKCTKLKMRSRNQHMTEGIRLANQEKIRMYLGILEVDIIKQAEMKEKLRNCISGEQGNFLKPSCIGEISAKG